MTDQLTFSWGERPASPSPSPDSEKEWTTLVATWPSHFSALLLRAAQNGLSGKMSLESCHLTEEGILEPSSRRWANSGMGGPTESWTLNSSEGVKCTANELCHNEGGACSLSDVLETGEVPRRFFLSELACQGILRRAERRGKNLPELLRQALTEAAGKPI